MPNAMGAVAAIVAARAGLDGDAAAQIRNSEILLMMEFVVAVFGPAREIHRWNNEHNQDVKRRRSLTQEIGDDIGQGWKRRIIFRSDCRAPSGRLPARRCRPYREHCVHCLSERRIVRENPDLGGRG